MAKGEVVVKAVDRFGISKSDLDREDGTSFGYYERLFLTWRDGKVFDYGDWHARDIGDMLQKDYKSAQLEQVLTGPIEQAEASVKPTKDDSGQAEWLDSFLVADEFSGGMDTPIDLVRSQMTSAFSMRKSFFEVVWTRGKGQFAGSHVPLRIAFRPADTCRTVRDTQGRLLGFEQEPWYLGNVNSVNEPIFIPLRRAIIYVHGQRRDPVNGVSDMDVPYWCYKTKQKVLFLWMQYAEQASLPRTVVKAQELGIAQQAAGQIARLKNSGVLPVAAPGGPGSLEVSTLDISGKGGEQFKLLIDWLDQAAVNANLAGFLNLTDHEKSGGSYALSSDASDFYLQRLESKTREMEREVRRQIHAPIVRLKYGPESPVPLYKIAPLNTEDVAPQVEMLSALLRSKGSAEIPSEFIEEIASIVCDRWGIDQAKMRTAFQSAAAKAAAMAKQMQMNQQAINVAKTAAQVNTIGNQIKKARTGVVA